jgi:A/G-specific adenine glycosylase
LIQIKKEEDFDSIATRITTDLYNPEDVISIEACNHQSIIHKLSHQHLYIKFWKVHLSKAIENSVTTAELKTFPFPIVIHNFIEKIMSNFKKMYL